jgi:Nitroreductase family
MHIRGSALPFWCGYAEAKGHGISPKKGSKAALILRPQLHQQADQPQASKREPADGAEGAVRSWVSYRPVAVFNGQSGGHGLTLVDLSSKPGESHPPPTQITDCSHLVVLLSQRTIADADADRLLQATAEARGLEASSLDGYRKMIQIDLINGPRSQIIERWSSNQVYIALGNLMTAAALLAIDTCAIEGFSPPDYDRILNLEASDYRTCVVCALGYRSPEDKYASLAKVRYPATELIEYR